MELAEIALTPVLGKPAWMWVSFLTIVTALLVFDLGVMHRKSHVIEMREALWLSAFYISLGLLFGVWVWYSLGPESALLYWTGFVVEQSLSIDNLFVMAAIFGYFGIPQEFRHKTLIYGILGVIILRGVMIGAGAAIVTEFEWVLYIFAVFLIFTGFKLLSYSGDEGSVGDNAAVRFLSRRMRVTKELHGERFFVRLPDPATGRTLLYATPLFLTLVTIEFADVIFAVDSVPAIFTITTDTYIVYTSNIFAILGLRALFFAVSALMERFAYLKYALAILLIFIGSKVFMKDLLGLEKFPPSISLGVTLAILAIGVFYSLWRTRRSTAAAE